MENFSAWLKDALDAAGMSPRKLAIELKVSPQTIINYLETGKANPAKKKMVYDYFEKLNGTPAPEELPNNDQPINPGSASDEYNALKEAYDQLLARVETIEKWNEELREDKVRLHGQIQKMWNNLGKSKVDEDDDQPNAKKSFSKGDIDGKVEAKIINFGDRAKLQLEDYKLQTA